MMQVYNKNVAFGILTGLAILLTGCMDVGQPLDATLKPAGSEQKADPSSLKRFQSTTSDGSTAVESAIELSKKYAALSDEMVKVKEEKQNISDENRRLKERIAVLEPELTQAKKELAEANDLLVEMRIELNNWKTDVLGFRDEMRNADKVQLETLVKILKVLGGETKDLSPEQDTSAEAAK